LHSNAAISIQRKEAAIFRISATIVKLVIAIIDVMLGITTTAISNSVFAYLLVIIITLATAVTTAAILFR